MLAQDTPLHVVSEVLGHASIAITEDVYGHLLEILAHDLDRFLISPWYRWYGATQRYPGLIRRFLRGRPAPYESVRDLGLVSPGCPCGSEPSQGCSPMWLPARTARRMPALGANAGPPQWFLSRVACVW